jgi:hypothetical protein
MSSDQSMGADDWMGTDSIEFRSRGAGVHERVVVRINGTELTDLWVAARQQPTDPLPVAEVGTGLAAWSEHGELPPRHEGDAVPDGSVPVLTCTCGQFGCGGASARITFERATVAWGDFRTATYQKPVALGPFRFKRHHYEEALRTYQ